MASPAKIAAARGGKIQSERGSPAKKSSVVSTKKVQSFSSGKPEKTTELSADDLEDEWRFEIKRKQRRAGRKNAGSTAKKNWYYWVVRVHRASGIVIYYGTLDVLDAADPARLEKYWQRSRRRKNG